jgi:hypothetical protein
LAKPTGHRGRGDQQQFHAAIQKCWQVTGDIGLFAQQSPRNSDGSCAAGQPSRHGVDMIAFSGTLSF